MAVDDSEPLPVRGAGIRPEYEKQMWRARPTWVGYVRVRYHQRDGSRLPPTWVALLRERFGRRGMYFRALTKKRLDRKLDAAIARDEERVRADAL